MLVGTTFSTSVSPLSCSTLEAAQAPESERRDVRLAHVLAVVSSVRSKLLWHQTRHPSREVVRQLASQAFWRR